MDKFIRKNPNYIEKKGYLWIETKREFTVFIEFLKDFTKLKTSIKKHDGAVWIDDNIELIFDPSSQNKQLNKLIINPIGTVFDNVRWNAGDNFNCKFKAGIFKDRGYWAAELQIHGSELLDKVEQGRIWSMNIFPFRKGPAYEGMSIWPSYGETHNSIHLFPLVMFK